MVYNKKKTKNKWSGTRAEVKNKLQTQQVTKKKTVKDFQKAWKTFA